MIYANDVFPFQSVLSLDSNNLITGDRATASARMQGFYSLLYKTGVYHSPADQLQVFSGSGLGITVRPGVCMINGGFAWFDAVMNLNIDPGTTTARTDLIVLRSDPTTERNAMIYVLKGGSVVGDLTRNANMWEVALARITVGQNAVAINQGNIQDLRPLETWCGTFTGKLPEPDFEGYYAQFVTQFENLITQLGIQKTDQQNEWQTQLTNQQTVFDGLVSDYSNFKAIMNNWRDLTINQLASMLSFAFGNQFALPGTYKTMTMAGNTLNSEIKTIADDYLIAKRTMTNNMPVNIVTIEDLYEPETGVLIYSRKMTTTLVGGFPRTEVVQL